MQKEKEKRDRLKELEISYAFPGYKSIVDDFTKANAKKAPAKSSEKVAAPKEIKKTSSKDKEGKTRSSSKDAKKSSKTRR